MSNYGFNENEIVATKIIQIDKDGFHRVVEETDGGSSATGGLKDFTAVVACDPENENNICVRALIRIGSDVHTVISNSTDMMTRMGIVIDPLNSVDPSTLPETMSFGEMVEFSNAHTSLSSNGMFLRTSLNDPVLRIGDKSYMMYSVTVPNPADSSQFIDYTLPVVNLESQGKITQILDEDDGTNQLVHYELDLTILVNSPIDGTEKLNIFADTVHVVTPEYSRRTV